MKLLIFTSKDHIYGNYLLRRLAETGTLSPHQVTVLEQDWIIPHRKTTTALLHYMKISGMRYVMAQALKQWAFKGRRWMAQHSGDTRSPYYPYYRVEKTAWKRLQYQGLKRPAAVEFIASLNPDVILSVYSKEIIPRTIWSIPPLGCFNLHPAPLPRYRGVSPVVWMLAHREKEMGITLHRVDSGIDTGEIVSQEVFPISPGATEHSVYLQCSELAVAMLDRLLKVGAVPAPPRRPDDGSESYYSFPTRAAIKDFYRNGNRFFRWREFSRPIV